MKNENSEIRGNENEVFFLKGSRLDKPFGCCTNSSDQEHISEYLPFMTLVCAGGPGVASLNTGELQLAGNLTVGLPRFTRKCPKAKPSRSQSASGGWETFVLTSDVK